ncbi:hypothetical protein FHX64_000810 [Microbacter margulisiae]|uniref:Uncharacterized protein n=1 Tax=Microbacter margulisiae TaxID=1350067 RepID=A0A7W5H1R6_9PORP|nr:hypothetical protein [Microbacter margulisiae]
MKLNIVPIAFSLTAIKPVISESIDVSLRCSIFFRICVATITTEISVNLPIYDIVLFRYRHVFICVNVE